MNAPFKTVPDADDLNSIQRRMTFHPAALQNAQTLTGQQIEQFNRLGFLQKIRIFPPEEIASVRRYFDQLLAETLAQGGDSYSISSAHLTYDRVYDLLTDSRIVDRVGDLLGENVIAWGSHFFCKTPGDGKAVSWHQDASYWPLSPSKTVTVWLAIDDADRENACMKFVAGSHHSGHLTYRPSRPEEHNVLNQTVDDALQYGELAYNELQAGEISMHSDLLLHGSDANESTRRRCGLTLRYCAADVRAEMDWNQKGVWVRGGDATNHWANQPRPKQD